ncbi:MAG TPA: hypothetical protein VJ874_03810 [Candidatus Thermoplasmatota archaeon]|nr:hypothetical protein [Candidatus Thermoplasmatota archaeon]
MRRALLCVMLLGVGLAGCLTGQGDDEGAAPAMAFEPFVPPIPDFDFTTVIDPDHGGHSVASLHTAGHGLELVGHASVQDLLPLGVRGSITAIDVWNDYVVVAGMEGGLAFAIVDVSDKSNPVAVGWANSPANGWTARFSEDGDYVFYGCQMVGLQSTPTNPGHLTGTCQDPDQVHLPADVQPGSNPAGVSVWDVSDKTQPRFVTFTEVAGSHNIFYQRIGGEDYVFTSATAILKFDREAMSLDVVAEVPGRHDSSVVRHPLTGDWLLLTGTEELTIYDVDDPAAPEIVYEGKGREEEPFIGWHDQVLVPQLVDGKAILVLAGESSCNNIPQQCSRSTGERLPDIISIVDVTNPLEPVLLSQWQPPFATSIPWNSYLWSVHEMAATPQGQVVISWYHAGVWVLDLSTQDRQSHPPILAAYQPHEDINVLPSTFVQTPLPYVPFVWSAAWHSEGYLLVPDMHTGLYVLEPEWGLHPALDTGQ